VPYGWPTKQVLYDSLQAGRGLPVWRTDQLSGSVALTQPQALYTYPFDFLYWLVPPLVAVGPTLLIHLLIAALGCVVLGRRLGLGVSGRTVMGVAGLVSFKLMLVVFAGWTPVLPSLSLLPWLAAALYGFAGRPDAARGFLLATVVALALLAGTIQYPYYLAILSAPYLLWKIVRFAAAGDSLRARKLLLGGLAAAGLGFMIAAHLWLPIFADLPLLARKSLSYSVFLAGHALQPMHLATLLSPEWLGTPRLGTNVFGQSMWEEVMYFGWVPLGLAALALMTRWRLPVVRWLALTAVVSTLLAFETPVLRGMFDWFPGYSLFRCPARILFVTSYIVIALAGFGADALAARIRNRSPMAALLAIAALVAFMTGEGFVRARQYLEVQPHETLEPALPVVASLAADTGPYRLAQVSATPPNFVWGAAAGLEFVNGYDPYTFEHYRRYLELLGQVQLPSPFSQVYLTTVRRFDMLDALNVRYLLSDRRMELPNNWNLVAAWPRHPSYQFSFGRRISPLQLYERIDPVARAFLVQRVVSVDNAKQARRAMMKQDLLHAAIVETTSEDELRNEVSPGDVLEVVEAQPGRLVLRSRTSKGRFAVLSEVWHPGWSATIDAVSARLFRTDGALLGLRIPPGQHDIAISFTPSHWHLGLVLGAAGVVLWLALALRVHGPAIRWFRKPRFEP